MSAHASIGDPPWPGYTPLLPPQPLVSWPAPPRCMPVNMPMPSWGSVTIAILDSDGNLTIKVDQPRPEPTA